MGGWWGGGGEFPTAPGLAVGMGVGAQGGEENGFGARVCGGFRKKRMTRDQVRGGGAGRGGAGRGGGRRGGVGRGGAGRGGGRGVGTGCVSGYFGQV